MINTKKHTRGRRLSGRHAVAASGRTFFLFILLFVAILSAVFFFQTNAAAPQNPQDILGIWRISGSEIKWKHKGTWEDSGVQDYENYYYEFTENALCTGGLIIDDKIAQPCSSETDTESYSIQGNKLIIEQRTAKPFEQQWQINKGKLELLSSDEKGFYKTILEKLEGAAAPTQGVTPVAAAENLSNVKCDGNFYQFRVGPAQILEVVNLFGDPDRIKKLEEEGFLYDKVELANNEKGYTSAPFKYSYYFKRDIDEVVGDSKTEKSSVAEEDSVWLANLSTRNKERLRELGVRGGDHLWDGQQGSGGRGADFSFSCEFTPVQEYKRGENPCTKGADGLICDNLNEALKNPGEVSELTLDYEFNGTVPPLKKFPKIRAMKRLKFLSITQQDFKKIPKNAFKNLTALDRMFISQTPITTLPSSIGDLRSLRYLSLRTNALRKIPKQIEKLQELYNLDLSYNQLREVPKELGQLPKLFVLDLAYNQITDLPNEFAQLKGADKTITEGKGGGDDLPPEAFLVQVDLTGNPISDEKQASLKKRFPNLHLKFSEEASLFTPG